jgi:pyruvate/2-oxoglutarate dehydrogenase complex dihydrolipoamide acyltransferase (E2) component
MATKVLMEALSPTMEEGRLVEWKKKEGDTVSAGDVLAEVETDKAVMDLVARAGGTLLKQFVTAGTTVPVAEVVAVIGQPGEEVAVEKSAGAKVAAPAAKPAARSSSLAGPCTGCSAGTCCSGGRSGCACLSSAADGSGSPAPQNGSRRPLSREKSPPSAESISRWYKAPVRMVAS